MRVQKKLPVFIFGIIFSIVGAFVLFLGIKYTKDYNQKKKTYIDVKGTVIYYTTKDGKLFDDYFDATRLEDELFAPVVQYVVNGKTYETIHKKYAYPPEYRIGQKVSLKYNPNNPEEVIFKYNNGHWIMLFVGGLFSVCGVAMTIAGIFKKSEE